MTYTRTAEGRIILDLSQEAFDELLLALGFAMGASAAETEGPDLFPSMIKLANLINEGNPNFLPYKLPPEPRKE